jgi:leader peptidase (prepilin peptidase) / N-methyltransferase
VLAAAPPRAAASVAFSEQTQYALRNGATLAHVDIFEVWPAALFVATGLVGLVAGSFLNVVAYRVPIMMELMWRRQCAELESEQFTPPPHAEGARFDLWWPRSACPGCGQPVAARHNIPVLSYLWLRGRCAHCGTKISRRYPIVEALAAIVGLIVAYRFGPTWQMVAAILFSWTLLALALIDLDHKLLPDSITLPLVWAGLLLPLVPLETGPLFTDLRSAVIGAAAGYLTLWIVYQLFKLATGKEGMGYGDFKLLAALGAWLGWHSLPLVILLSAAVGAVVGLAMILLAGRSRHVPIPFGPYLAGAGWIAMLWGEELFGVYERLLL